MNTYCSRKCYNEMRTKDKTKTSNYNNYNRREFICLNCNKINYVPKKTKKKFCNMKCRVEYLKLHPEAASNYKDGKFINCLYCGKQRWLYGWDLRQNSKSKRYCSVKCYMKDPNSPNRQYGNNNAMSNPLNREKVRNGVIKHILEKDVDRFRTGKNEKQILDYLENKYNIKIKRHYIIGGYIVDGYIEDKNLVIEIDEKYHKYYKQKDINKQKYLEENYKCHFLRIRDYIKEDLENARV